MALDILCVRGGPIHTFCGRLPRAAQLVIGGGRFLAVRAGDPPPPPGARVLDLGGACALPGLTDAHTHLAHWAIRKDRLDLSGARTAAECIERAMTLDAELPAGEWLQGRGWNHNFWPSKTLPSRKELDAVAGRPAALFSHDGHTMWCNSLALKEFGITSRTPDPAGGRIGRFPDGSPSGILSETAAELYRKRMPFPDAERLRRRIWEACADLNRLGIVACHNCEGIDRLDLFRRMEAEGELGLRLTLHPAAGQIEALDAAGVPGGFGSPRLRLGGVKAYLDGALGSRTAWMLEPYDDDPDNLGISTLDEHEAALIELAARRGYAPVLHAIGDAAVRRALDIIEILDLTSAALPPRVEHAQIVAPGDLERAGRIGALFSMQPAHIFCDIDPAEAAWGERGRRAFPFRSARNAGVRLAFGSDMPIETPDPWEGIHAAVRRCRRDGTPAAGWHPSEAIGVAEALAAYTIGGAIAGGEDAWRGSIAVGKLADLVVVRPDPLAPGADVRETKVLATFSDGKPVYVDPDAQLQWIRGGEHTA